jgi:L-lactate utilization protein LutB
MKEKEQYWSIRLENVRRALERNGMEALVVGSGKRACKEVLATIEEGASVGLGGSRTVEEIGLLDALRKGAYNLFDQYGEGLTREESMAVRKQGTHADYFVSGSNAITDGGKIVNTDGLGNRLAGFCFGPAKVIIVAGRNKIVTDLDAALDRVRNVAAPINARRFGAQTPCVLTGQCTDCDSPERICNLTLIIERQRIKGRMKVILVNEDLGF